MESDRGRDATAGLLVAAALLMVLQIALRIAVPSDAFRDDLSMRDHVLTELALFGGGFPALVAAVAVFISSRRVRTLATIALGIEITLLCGACVGAALAATYDPDPVLRYFADPSNRAVTTLNFAPGAAIAVAGIWISLAARRAAASELASPPTDPPGAMSRRYAPPAA